MLLVPTKKQEEPLLPPSLGHICFHVVEQTYLQLSTVGRCSQILWLNQSIFVPVHCSWTYMYGDHTLFSLRYLDSNNKILLDWHSRGNTLQTFREWLCILYASPTECTSTLLFWRVRPLLRHYIHVFGQWSRQWQQGIKMVYYIIICMRSCFVAFYEHCKELT